MIGSRGDNVYSYVQGMINRTSRSSGTSLSVDISNVHSNPGNYSFTAPQSLFGRTVANNAQGYARHYTRRS